MIFLGIDPGVNGGLALLSQDGKPLLVRGMPDTERDIFGWMASLARPTFTYIERVGCNGKNGSKGNWVLSASYHGLRMALIGADIPFEAVTPVTWQKEFKLPTLKQAGSPVKKKNAHKARAQELFPELKITHAIADALLIAEYARRERTK